MKTTKEVKKCLLISTKRKKAKTSTMLGVVNITANARKRRRDNKKLGITPKKYTRKKIDVRNNPDKERIREAIRAEESSAQAAQN